jgi:hypothetical protein
VIIGIGTDLVDIRRIASAIERHGDRFVRRVFTKTECALAERRNNRVETYARPLPRRGIPPGSISPSPTNGRWLRLSSSFRQCRPRRD